MKTIFWILTTAAIIGAFGFAAYKYRLRLYSIFTSKGLNNKGGDITIINAKIWTGDPQDPWKNRMVIKNGKIVSMNGAETCGKIINAEGRLIVPGFHDSHCHPHVPFILLSPEAPMLQKSKSVKEVLEKLKDYVKKHPEDIYPRLFGWMDSIFKDGEKPNRHMIDEVVSDRPVFLVHSSGHRFWANTKALELAGIFEKDPEELGTGEIIRDPETGLATGLLEETEYAATDGILLRSVEKLKPINFDKQVLILRYILDEYSKVGVTSIWTKEGNLGVVKIYEQLLRDDSLPVRTFLDVLYTPFSKMKDFKVFAEYAKTIAGSDMPKEFIRSDGVKILVDMVPESHQAWFFKPYSDGIGGCGKSVFPLNELQAQIDEADKLGLHLNLLCIGDKAVHEGLNLLEKTAKINPPRERRHVIEHADFIVDEDIPRFRELGVTAIFNPIGLYPDEGFVNHLKKLLGEERMDKEFCRCKELIADGALVVNGSDFPLAPMDPLVGMNLLVNSTDLEGNPKGGIWPKKMISVEDALKTYTVNAAKAAFAEDHLGLLKEGYDADFVMLSENILSKDFSKENLVKVKAVLTVMNGHIVHEDFSGKEKSVEFGE